VTESQKEQAKTYQCLLSGTPGEMPLSVHEKNKDNADSTGSS